MHRFHRTFWGASVCLFLIGCGGGNASAKRQQALDAVDRQDWDDAISLCTEAIRLDPKNVDGWWLRGLGHLKKKEHVKAEADCTEAIKLDGNYTAAYRERGLALLGQEKHPEAIADFTAYLRLRPDDAEVYGWRALAHSRNGDKAAASADLRNAEKLKGTKK